MSIDPAKILLADPRAIRLTNWIILKDSQENGHPTKRQKQYAYPHNIFNAKTPKSDINNPPIAVPMLIPQLEAETNNP